MTFGRGFLAVLSALGLLVGIVGFVGSFWGLTIAPEWPWVAVLGAGAMAVSLPIYGFGRLRQPDRNFLDKRMWLGFPAWITTSVRVVFAIAILQFVVLSFRCHLAVPTELDGSYQLRSRGQVVKVLTEQEFLSLKAEELRTYGTLDVLLYFVPLMYWSFKSRVVPLTTSAHP